MADFMFPEILPKEEQKYYNKLTKPDKELLQREFPRVYLKNGALLLVSEDVYWMAQAIYWEARNVPAAWKYIGWVVRNRQEFGKWGTTYKTVVTSGSQFSPNIVKGRDFLIKEVRKNQGEWNAWLGCVREAMNVNGTPDFSNPIPGVTHFYSPVSRKTGTAPHWAPEMGEVEVSEVRSLHFRFFKEK